MGPVTGPIRVALLRHGGGSGTGSRVVFACLVTRFQPRRVLSGVAGYSSRSERVCYWPLAVGRWRELLRSRIAQGEGRRWRGDLDPGLPILDSLDAHQGPEPKDPWRIAPGPLYDGGPRVGG